MSPTERPWLIGLAGESGTGKDTVARILSRIGGYQQRGWADKVKDFAEAVDPYIPIAEVVRNPEGVPLLGQKPAEVMKLRRLREIIQQCREASGSKVPYDEGWRKAWDLAKGLPEVRRTLQRVGTEGGRMVIGREVWINALFDGLRGPKEPDELRLAISDVRFPNEGEAIRRRMGVVWRIIRPVGLREDIGQAHESEQVTVASDVTLHNEGTLDELEAAVRELIE